jgi:hypothetical protein
VGGVVLARPDTQRLIDAQAHAQEIANEKTLMEMYPPLIVKTDQPEVFAFGGGIDLRAGSVNLLPTGVEILGWNGHTFESSKERVFRSSGTGMDETTAAAMNLEYWENKRLGLD